MLRSFFDRIIEWDWADAPATDPDLQPSTSRVADDPLPRFLDDPHAARFAAAASIAARSTGSIVELLARTGMRAGELARSRRRGR